jgi:hypothetical protein
LEKAKPAKKPVKNPVKKKSNATKAKKNDKGKNTARRR